jgi:drug/metabolite transporter (DMT)-like permease
LATGLVGGLQPALSRLVAMDGVSPLFMGFWVSLVAAMPCLAIALCRSGLQAPTWRFLGFLAIWALVAGISSRLVLFVVAERVNASMIALVSGLRGFMVLGLAAAIGAEALALRRLLGLATGFSGVALAMIAAARPEMGVDLWLVATLAFPFLLAIQNLLMARPVLSEVDPFGAVGQMLLLSAAVFGAAAIIAGHDLALNSVSLQHDLLVAALGLATGATIALALLIVIRAGPVFASQAAYTTTIAGIVWGMLLLGEALPLAAWGGLVLVVAGMWLVEPARADATFRLRRVYSD